MPDNKKTLIITDLNFEEFFRKNNLLMLDFWAPWCGPCRMLSPIIDELSQEAGDAFLVAKVNVDENSFLTTKFEIKTIPTIVIIKEGVGVSRKIGLSTKAELWTIMQNYLNHK